MAVEFFTTITQGSQGKYHGILLQLPFDMLNPRSAFNDERPFDTFEAAVAEIRRKYEAAGSPKDARFKYRTEYFPTLEAVIEKLRKEYARGMI